MLESEDFRRDVCRLHVVEVRRRKRLGAVLWSVGLIGTCERRHREKSDGRACDDNALHTFSLASRSEYANSRLDGRLYQCSIQIAIASDVGTWN